MMVEAITNGQAIAEKPPAGPKRGEAFGEADFAGTLAMTTPSSQSRSADAGNAPADHASQETAGDERADSRASVEDRGRGDDGKSSPEAGSAAADDTSAEGSNPVEEAKQESSHDGSPHPDSGQGRTVVSPMSVDGRENGVHPGASTEATVSAPSTDGIGNHAASPVQKNANPQVQVHSPETEAAVDVSPLLAKLLPDGLEQQQALDAAPMPQSSGDDVKVSARVISARSAASVDWFALAERGVVFETGLAEQIVRALTDDFRDLRVDDSANASAAKVSGPAPSTGSPNVTQTQGSVLNQSLQAMLSPADDSEASGGTLGRLMNVLRNNIGQRHSQLTVQLEPPELGRMRIDVRLTDNHMRLNISTETEQARQMITQRFDVLRSALENQGITVSRFDVQTRPFPQDAQHGQDGRHQPQHGGQLFQMNQDGQRSPQRSYRARPPALGDDDDAVEPTPLVMRTAFSRPRMSVDLVA